MGFADGAGSSAMFYNPTGVAVDSAGNVYVADSSNNRIRVVSPGGVVSTLAGTGGIGSADGAASSATFNDPQGVAVGNTGNVYVADSINSRIRVISPGGNVSTLAGGSQGAGFAGFADGDGSSAQFFSPHGVAVDGVGNVYVADTANHRIRVVSPSGSVSTLAGGSWGFADGSGMSAQFNSPRGVAVDSAGNVYVADMGNNRIRLITNGTVSTLAGGGVAGFADGIGLSAQFSSPQSVAVDGAGNIYVVDSENRRIRFVSPSGVVSTLAGNGISSFADGAGLSAQFSTPVGVAVGSDANMVIVADNNGNRPLIRKLVIAAGAGAGAGSPQQAAPASPLVTSLSALATQLALLTQLLAPLTCDEPGGDRLRFSNGTWKCVCTVGWSGSSCDVPPRLPIILTSCGVTGRTGPTLAQCQATYSSNFSFGYPPTAVTLAAVWQRLAVSQGGVYNITVAGASSQGGAMNGVLYSDRFRGAIMSHSSIYLGYLEVLYVMVGQMGSPGNGLHAGGGGGTFVLSANGTALLVAGGGGGVWNTVGSPGLGDASVNSTTGQASFFGVLGGSNGDGGSGGPRIGYGAGGGGLIGDGMGSAESSGASALNGGLGGLYVSDPIEGGFGGGSQLGGGGGYSGGGGCTGNGGDVCGGGGSFCLGGFSNCATGYNVGNGWVSIVYLHA